MTNRDWLSQQSHEQLQIFVTNLEYQNELLRDKLSLLTGCRGFGNADGMDGSCVECFYTTPEHHKRCVLFQETFRKYREEKRAEKEKNEMERVILSQYHSEDF